MKVKCVGLKPIHHKSKIKSPFKAKIPKSKLKIKPKLNFFSLINFTLMIFSSIYDLLSCI